MDTPRPTFPTFDVTLATAAFAMAASLRFGRGYDFTQQGLLVLIEVALGMLCLKALWGLARTPHGRRRHLFAVACHAAALGCVLLVALESHEANRRKNREYLERLARIAAAYTERHGMAPEQFEQALKEATHTSGTVLPNRGDADGHVLKHRRLGGRAFLLASPRAEVSVTYRDGVVTSAPAH